MDKLIKEAEQKLEELSEKSFIEYFEKIFLPKIKNINYALIKECNTLADNLPVAEFQDQIKYIMECI